MDSRISKVCIIRSRPKELKFLDMPIECIRKMRSLNMDGSSCRLSREEYGILRSANGRRVFHARYGNIWE